MLLTYDILVLYTIQKKKNAFNSVVPCLSIHLKQTPSAQKNKQEFCYIKIMFWFRSMDQNMLVSSNGLVESNMVQDNGLVLTNGSAVCSG